MTHEVNLWLEKVTILRNKKKFLKRNLSILENYLAEIDTSEEQKDKIQRQLETCVNYFATFNQYFEEIYDETHDEELNVFFEEQQIISALVSKLKLAAMSRIQAQLPESNLVCNSSSVISNLSVKLPSINLPEFSGKTEEYLSFVQSFDSLIHVNQNLKEVEKLQYLVACLKGEAYEVIRSLEINAANYVNARELLQERYENKRASVNKHIKAIVEIQPVTKGNFGVVRSLLNVVTQNVRALSALERPVDQWDDILIYLIVSKLPVTMRLEWENQLTSSSMPQFEELKRFLIHKCQMFESVNETIDKSSKIYNKNALVHVSATKRLNQNLKCNFCADKHFTSQCEILLKMPINERFQQIKERKLCYNCLRPDHVVTNCRSSRCRTCQGKHNTILHFEKHNEISAPTEVQRDQQSSATSLHANDVNAPANVLLSTCVIEIKNVNGQYIKARALLDSGSQINLITQELAKKLGLKPSRMSLNINGINEQNTNANEHIRTTIRSQYNRYSRDMAFFVLRKITGRVPYQTFSSHLLRIPKNIHLADPLYHVADSIDLLIGAQFFYELLCVGQIKTSSPGIILQKSVLGWIVAGTFSSGSSNTVTCGLNTLKEINNTMTRFWTIEGQLNENLKTAEEIACEEHFIKTITRDTNGQFIAALPWKKAAQSLGSSFEIAKKRLFAIERRHKRYDNERREYVNFMREYLELNHMSEIGTIHDFDKGGYFLPHHAVYKEESTTTKTRIVFDASAGSSNSLSLNDCLMLGPVIQDDIFTILIRFRLFEFVLTADISKMYRQIKLKSEDTEYQKILWRFNMSDPIKVYKLNTLTYGTKPASFIATRCLLQIAREIEKNKPKIAEVLKSDFYMDDLLTGGDNVDDLIKVRTELSQELGRAGFTLRKWATNCPALLETIDSDEVNIIKSEQIKTLGVSWSPRKDTIEYKSNLISKGSRISKRVILSCIAQIFDPLGLLGPVITIAKLLMQEIWKLDLKWDEAVPQEIHTRWSQFTDELKNLPNISIPRKVLKLNATVEIHGFADASEKAYGACVYIKSLRNNEEPQTFLLCAKSRVAPLKVITLPRLELCAALLLTELVEKLQKSCRIKFDRVLYYTDSTITLAWIRACPSRWKTFVANRVTEIQNRTSIEQWYHVSSKDNPADIISRGSYPSVLANQLLWWRGPEWLNSIRAHQMYDNSLIEMDLVNIPEVRVLAGTQISERYDLFYRYSELHKLIRVVTRIIQFVQICRKGGKCRDITPTDLINTEHRLVKLVQKEVFGPEIIALNKNNLNKNSKILNLSPFLDDSGIIRVGGRLGKTKLEYNKKHPILLPSRHPFTDLIIKSEHLKQLHIGAQGTLAATRSKYWIISGRNSVRRVIRKCITCFKQNAQSCRPVMGDLPVTRVESARVFSKVGLDYFGPLNIKEGGRRSRKTRKTYGCLFICMATKAVHIELVDDLTTEAFLASLKRFASRRGLPVEIFSDNATNFKGAAKELKYIINELHNTNSINCELLNKGIRWNFNPPAAPHFGGLWEAAVKSFKKHLSRIAGNALLTYTEMLTLLIEIESILNSRPLTPLSNDPNDLDYLTPGHFLVGGYLQSVPELDATNSKTSSLSRWQLVQRLQQHFWKRWFNEYVMGLQQRRKWTKSKGVSLKVGLLVLIREDNLPSRCWKMGRIIALHPGSDGVVRAATVKTSTTIVKRPAVRLCVLPIEEETLE